MTRDRFSHPVSIAGVMLTTASAVIFIALVIAIFAGLLQNPYAGLIVFVALPAVFVLGLILIPVGAWLRHRALQRHPELAGDWPVIDFRRPRVRRIALVVAALTAVNVVILLLAGYGSLHWMESPSFCGEVCHTPMHPQFTAWQNGPHPRIACATCHISEGAAGFVHAKLNGTRQLVQMMTNTFPRPIPPGAKMPEGAQAQTCGRCHQPGRPVGDRIRVIREYADDEANTETTTILQMNVGGAGLTQRSIHWHANPAIRVEYIATDPERQTIPYVKVTDANGKVTEYVTPDTTADTLRAGTRSTVDCVECHNTVGHPVSETAERAVDRAIAAGLVNRGLPFVRRESIRLVKASYPSQDAASHAIDEGLRTFYRSHGGSVEEKALTQAIGAVQDVYQRNVFPTMNVTWGSYPDNRGHIVSPGCVRCHDDSHKSKDGKTISGDCDFCHKQLDTEPQ
jgi:hypothetical protein